MCECVCVCECDRETSIIRRLCPVGGCCVVGGGGEECPCLARLEVVRAAFMNTKALSDVTPCLLFNSSRRCDISIALIRVQVLMMNIEENTPSHRH